MKYTALLKEPVTETCADCGGEWARLYKKRSPRCPECRATNKRKVSVLWQDRNRDRINEYQRLKNATRDKATRRNYALKKYGVTQADYDAMSLMQGGRCEICGALEAQASRHGVFDVDHNHVTGVVRGLLCGPCNRAVGLLNEDTHRMAQMIKYLESR